MGTNARWQVFSSGCTFGSSQRASILLRSPKRRVKSEARREIYLPKSEADDLQDRDSAESACQDGWHPRGLSQPDRQWKPGAWRCTASSNCRRASLRGGLAFRKGKGCAFSNAHPRGSAGFLTIAYLNHCLSFGLPVVVKLLP